jgi:arginine/lysine/ornithine decarboxylase
LYAVGDLVHHNGGLVQVRGVMAAANKRDRFWYIVESRTVAKQTVRESALRVVRNGERDHA